MAQVFSTQAADGASSEVTVYPGGAVIYVAGNLGGGSVAVQVKDPAGAWHTLDGAPTITAAGAYQVSVNAPVKLRLNVTGATTPSIDAWVESNIPSTERSVEGR